MASYVAGIDLGTSVVKATVVAAEPRGLATGEASHAVGEGGVVAAAERAMAMRHPAPGQAEQDPGEYVAAALATLGEAVAQAQVGPGEMAAIAFSGQMGGALAIDRTGTAISPWYPSTLDMRYQPYLAPVMAAEGAHVLALSGAAPILAPRMAWWRAEQPYVHRRLDKVLLLANYVAAQLGGLRGEAVCTDPSYLTWTGLADTQRRAWSPQLAELWDVAPEHLPRIVPAGSVIGGLSAAAALECGLREGTPLVVGAGDQVAGFLGAGLVQGGQLIDVAGTFGVFATCLDRFFVDSTHGMLQSLAGPLGEDHWYAMMYIGGGGLTHHWFVEQSGQTYGALDALAAEVAPGAQGLLCIPHLLGRACPPDPAVRGAWLGFTWTHTQAHFYRALLEAIAYDYAQALDVLRAELPHLEYDAVRVIGGGAKSTVWNQIKADVLGLPYVRLPAGDRAALGCAILAGHGAGIFPDMRAAAQRLAEPCGRVEPHTARHAFYRPYVEAYCGAFRELRGLYATLETLRRAPWPPEAATRP
jgi:xylulokinase